MFRNYLLTGIRNLWKNKSFSAINILGLSIGMASAILILLWVQNEMSYDRFHEKQSQLYHAWNRGFFDGKLNCWASTPKILGKTLKQEYPEIREMSRVKIGYSSLATIGDRSFTLVGAFVDTGFLRMFNFPLLKGNPATALRGAYSFVPTEKLAKKLFGNENPIGKTFKLTQGTTTDQVIVTGILKDLPNNTTFDFEYLLPWENMTKLGWDDDYWGNNSVNTYVELKAGTDPAAFNEKIKNVTINHSKHEEDNEVFLYPLSRMHLYATFENGVNTGGRIELVRLFAIIAGLILLIACINFMNLSTARSEKRAKEVGIRKVVGALKQSLVGQFLGESLLIALIAAIIALAIVQLSLPGFNQLTRKQLFIPFANTWFWIAGVAFVLLTGIVAGSYPAFYLSSFRPIQVLKGTFQKVHALVTPRKLLVIVQFTIAIVLIICTIVVKQQIWHAQNRYAGYNKMNVGYVYLSGNLEHNKHYDPLKDELLSSGAITSITKTSAPLTESWSNSWGFEWPGKPAGTKIIFDRLCADQNLVKTAGFKLLQGRDMNLMEYPTDSSACLINESAMKAMGFKDPIGQIIKDGDEEWHVVGVFKDFIIGSPYQPMRGMIIQGAKAWFNVIHLKLNEANSTAENLKRIEPIFKKYNPQFPFDFHFVDQEYARKFNDEQQIGSLAGLFAGLTIFISCLGLFGLATYMAENRMKEIGVRKVLGASVMNITTLLSKDFLRLVIVSLLIATPIAWWAMNTWLQAFPYRVTLQWWVFAGAGVIAIAIALLTVSYKSMRAAMANPVKSLRTE